MKIACSVHLRAKARKSQLNQDSLRRRFTTIMAKNIGKPSTNSRASTTMHNRESRGKLTTTTPYPARDATRSKG